MYKMLAVAVVTLLSSGQAFANCYEDIGCDDEDRFTKSDLRQLSCQALYEVRNGIFYQNGYCFHTGRAYEIFGNDGCYIEDQADVEMSRIERFNVNQIAAVERQKRC